MSAGSKAAPPVLGGKVRALRRRERLTQAELALRLGVSPSYLNLIESNRRPLPAPLLIKLAQLFQIDLQSFAVNEDVRLTADLLEVFDDPLFESHSLMAPEVRELATSAPQAAEAVVTLYRAYQHAQEALVTLKERISGAGSGAEVGQMSTRLPSEEVTDFIQRHLNYFPVLEAAADALRNEARLELDGDGLYRGLVRHLAARGVSVRIAKVGEDGGAVRRYDPESQTIMLSELLRPRSRSFQLAHQVALLLLADTLRQLSSDSHLTTTESRAVCQVALANYFAAALMMPYDAFLQTAREERYDVELLGHRFRASFEQICHRLTTLRRPGSEGVPFHLLRVDIAGNISKRFSASGLRFARFAGACPRWNVHAAFLTPGLIRTQLSRMPDGTTYFCVASTLRKDSGGYHAAHPVWAIALGCEVSHARELVYADGVDLTNLATAVPVGLTCRLCERMDCEQRAFPPLHHPIKLDVNVRGANFYAPPDRDERR